MGGSSSQTVGYWYHPTFMLGLHQGPFDAFLRFRAADLDAWSGELTASGTITINKPDLWGGTESEGGIQGDVDVRFGEATQMPSAYYDSVFGADPSAHRGAAVLIFKGEGGYAAGPWGTQYRLGRFGAMNPYPKPVAVMTRRILKGWDDDACWYPEKAEILLQTAAPAPQLDDVLGITTYTGDGTTARTITGIDLSAGGISWIKRRDAASAHSFCYSLDGSIVRRLDTSSGGDEGLVVDVDFGVGGTTLDGATFNVDSASYVNWTFQKAPRFLDIVEYDGNGGVQAVPHQLGSAPGLIVIKKISGTSGATGWLCWHKDLGAGAYIGLNGTGAAVPSEEIWQNTDPTATAFTIGSPVDTTVHLNVDGNRYVAFLFAHDASMEGAVKAFSYVGQVAVPFSVDMGIAPQLFLTIPSNELHPRHIYDQVRQPNYSGNELTIDIGNTTAEISAAPDLFELQGDGVEFLASGFVPNVNTTPVYGLAFGYGTEEPRDGTELIGMNPAHIIYDSLVAESMQGEPVALVNDASFRAAADTLYDEGFGLCTEWDPDRETCEAFRQRICNIIGAQCSRSTVDGLWYLDLARGDYDFESLPVLTDDDVLEFQMDPSTLDDAVNQVTVRWFDPMTKQERTTAPVHALGAIHALGGIVPETIAYPEIPFETLADRCAARDLRAKATPTKRFTLTTNRKPYSWRRGIYFRLQLAKRGIADMVCIVGEISKGTLRSGAIKLVAMQDVYSMPATSYVVGQPPIDGGTTPPVPVEQQVAFEAPYTELAGTLTAADLAALDLDAGFLQVAGVRPGAGTNYQLRTRLSGGEFVSAGVFDWCPGAIVDEAAGPTDTAFTLSGGTDLFAIAIGSAGLWGDEIVRVDAIDIVTGAATFGRGCADTVPALHPAGERIYFFDAWSATDQVEYVTAEVVEAKLLTRTGTAMIEEADAATLSVEFAQRAYRPYPPAGLQLNALAYPDAVFGAITATWVHRDRVLQADQLLDTLDATVGPEAGTTYTAHWYLDGVEVHTEAGISGTSAAYSPSSDGLLRVEIEAIRDGASSWQRLQHECDYTVAEVDYYTNESGDRYVDQDGNPYIGD